MNQFKEFEAQQRAALKPKAPNELQCPTCQNRWFEPIRAMTLDKNITYTLHQTPMPTNEHWVLKCLRCGDLQELPIVFNSVSRKDQDNYMEMHEELSQPFVKESKEEVKQEEKKDKKA